MKNFLNIFVSMTLSLILLTSAGSVALQPQQTNAQNITEGNPTPEENKHYILIFGQRIIGNVDNSTKIVSSIIGHNSVKIQEEFLEEISLAPSQQLEDQVEKVINDGRNGKQCGVNLTTQDGQKIIVDCLSSGNTLIWYVYQSH